MESQSKPGPNGTPGSFASPGYGVVAPSKSTRTLGIVLRALAVALTLVATIVMGAARETAKLIITDSTTDQTVETLTATVKSTYSSAFVYFIVANAILFVYSSLSMAISIAKRASSENLPLLSIADLVMVALLFSGNGAATAIGVVAENGNSDLGWDKFCNVYDNFCARITASIVLSMIAALAYVLLLLLSIINLHKRSQ